MFLVGMGQYLNSEVNKMHQNVGNHKNLIYLFDKQSTPQLVFGLILLLIFKRSSFLILWNLNLKGFLCPKKSWKLVDVWGISAFNFGPMSTKKSLKPFAIDSGSFNNVSFTLKNDGRFPPFFICLPNIELIRLHVALMSFLCASNRNVVCNFSAFLHRVL